MRPPARLFKPDEIGQYGGDVEQRTQGGRKLFYFDGETFEDGLLLRDVSVRSLRWGDDIVPSLAELERFKAGLGAGAEEELLAAVTPQQLAPKENYSVGDVVKVKDGDLKNIVGVVQKVDQQTGTVIVLPTAAGLGGKGKLFKEGLAFENEQLQKWFKMGDHVKVVGGTRHVGVRIEPQRAEHGGGRVRRAMIEQVGVEWLPARKAARVAVASRADGHQHVVESEIGRHR